MGLAMRGRPRKPEEKPEDIVRQAVEARKRDLELDGIFLRPRPGETKVHALDVAHNVLTGSTLGRLLLRHKQSPRCPDSIDHKQYQAGQEWVRIVHAHSRIHGYSLTLPSLSSEYVGGSRGGSTPEEDPERVLEIRRQYSDCYRALMDTGVSVGRGPQIALLMWACCIENRPLKTFSMADIGNIRLGLNAIRNVLS